jgi:hypothetical protein
MGSLLHVSLIACVCGAAPGSGETQPAAGAAAELVSVRKIWDRAPHNAFTDLIRFEGKWFCTFRESEGHVGGDGKLRVLVSTDGDTWESAALLAEKGVDLRDPKLSITPDGRLMIVAGGSVYRGRQRLTNRSRVAFSADGRDWTAPQPVLPEHEWLWRVTWHAGKAYGVSYKVPYVKGGQRELTLWSSDDGIHYDRITGLDVDGQPSETTLRFRPDGEVVALVRRSPPGIIGTSRPPYTKWQWHSAGQRLGGPNFIVLPDGSMWAASRSYPGGAKTVVSRVERDSYEPVLTLPSGGDCSYPGLVWHDGLLWVSYYSSHEGKTSIYLAKVRVRPEAEARGPASRPEGR